MSENNSNMLDSLNKMFPTIVMAVAIWWFGTTNNRNSSVERMQVMVENMSTRLEKIEVRIDEGSKDRYTSAQATADQAQLRSFINDKYEEIEDDITTLRKRIRNLEDKN